MPRALRGGRARFEEREVFVTDGDDLTPAAVVEVYSFRDLPAFRAFDDVLHKGRAFAAVWTLLSDLTEPAEDFELILDDEAEPPLELHPITRPRSARARPRTLAA